MRFRWAVALAIVFAAGTAGADYYSHPELHPENRCADIPAGIGEGDPGGPDSIHCQRLFWDLEPVLTYGAVAVARAFHEDDEPKFPRGLTDRPPPIWVGNLKSDGSPEGFERESDCLANADDCERLCAQMPESERPGPVELLVPYWKELFDANGNPDVGPGDFDHHVVGDPSTPVTGPRFQVECTFGSRSYYGPWQTGATVDPQACKAYLDGNAAAEVIDGPCGNPIFDRIASTAPIRFENTERLNYFENVLGTDRAEWNVGSEYYNHYGSHHGTCSAPTHDCGRGGNGRPAEDYEEDGACWAEYSSRSHGAHERSDGKRNDCWSGDADPVCPGGSGTSGFRNATQIPGRLSVPLPNKDGEERGVLGAEDQYWGCNHHVVTQLPPGSYGITTRYINYRLQTGGVRNPRVKGVDCEADANDPDTPVDETRSCMIWGADAGEVLGGAVGEMIIQYFAKPTTANVKPINISFNALADAATTYYPPFTWNYHESEWIPPFDAQIALNAVHSHHRMVKGVMNVAPVNPPRPNAIDPNCGADKPNGLPGDLYTSWEWEDAPVCQYWKEEDGAVPIRSGQSLRTTCYVNNGVTPEAIKHGLVAGATVEVLKALSAPIPEYPETVPADTWGGALASSPVGTELLYGTHPPINYRVVYKCSNVPVVKDVPGFTLATAPANAGGLYSICAPNPKVDADGDYVDGVYKNYVQCGTDTDGDGVNDVPGNCQPGSIIFACIGEDEMCIGVSMYWAMPRLGSDSHDQAMAELEGGNVDNVGKPGNVGRETDVSGICTECEGGPGL